MTSSLSRRIHVDANAVTRQSRLFQRAPCYEKNHERRSQSAAEEVTSMRTRLHDEWLQEHKSVGLIFLEAVYKSFRLFRLVPCL